MAGCYNPHVCNNVCKMSGAPEELIDVDMEQIRKRIKPIYVKKTLTIPEWLNTKASEQGINFSQLLQEALKTKLGVS